MDTMNFSITPNHRQITTQEFPSLQLLRILLLASFLALFGILLNLISTDQVFKVLGNSRRWQFAIGLGLFMDLVIILIFALTWTKFRDDIQNVVQFVI